MAHPFRHADPRRLLFVALAGAMPLGLPLQEAVAAEPMSVMSQEPLRDPWVPPESRRASTAAPTEGAALRAQVERKLKLSFDAADSSHTGSLTRRQASAAGLGYVAQHFDEIDSGKTGSVRFEDVKRYLISRGAQLD
jgi:hypothetical protein